MVSLAEVVDFVFLSSRVALALILSKVAKARTKCSRQIENNHLSPHPLSI